MSYLLIHLAKDLRLEWRSKDAINGMLFLRFDGGGAFQPGL